MPNYVFLDLETTGTEPGSRIVGIGAIHTDADGKVICTFERLVYPGMPMPPDAGAINGLTDEGLEECDPTLLALGDFLQWLERCGECPVVVAHNAPFDVGVLSWELHRCNLELPKAVVFDTCAHARALKATKNNKLVTLVEHYGITMIGEPHTAMADADACRQYFFLTKSDVISATPWEAAYGYTEDVGDALEGIADLVAKGEPLAFEYSDAKGNVTKREIIPYGWAALADGSVAFHGLDIAKQERRTFKADRILTRIPA